MVRDEELAACEVEDDEGDRPPGSRSEYRAVEGEKAEEYAWDLNSKSDLTGLERVSNMGGEMAGVEDSVGAIRH